MLQHVKAFIAETILSQQQSIFPKMLFYDECTFDVRLEEKPLENDPWVYEYESIRQSGVINLMKNGSLLMSSFGIRLCKSTRRTDKATKRFKETKGESNICLEIDPFQMSDWSGCEHKLSRSAQQRNASGCVAFWSMMNDIIMRQKQKVFVL